MKKTEYDDTESEKDNGRNQRKKKKKKEEEEEKKWDDVDLKKILKKERELKKIEVLVLSLPHKLGAIIFFVL